MLSYWVQQFDLAINLKISAVRKILYDVLIDQEAIVKYALKVILLIFMCDIE